MRATWSWTLLAIVLIAGGSYGLYLYLAPEPLPEQVLYGNGHVEATEVAVAAEIAGRVIESTLSEGTSVAKGDLLARLDDTELRLIKAQAAAESEALRQERASVAREREVWRHHLGTAEKDLARYRELRAQGTVPPQRLEQAEDAYQEARGQIAALDAKLAALEGRQTAAERKLDLVVDRIGKTRISAPIGGTVLVKAVEAGEFVQPGRTVAVLADLARVELKVFLPERDIGKIRLDAPARVRVDAFPGRDFDARIARVDDRAQFTPRDIHMPEERVRMVFGVTLALDNPDGVLKPGMPADAWILWPADGSWPERLFVPG